MTDRVLPPEEIAKSVVELLRDTPLAADERELGRFVRLSPREQFVVAILVEAGEAETVQDALDSMAEREEAHSPPHIGAYNTFGVYSLCTAYPYEQVAYLRLGRAGGVFGMSASNSAGADACPERRVAPRLDADQDTK